MTTTKNRLVDTEAAPKAFGGAGIDYSIISARMEEEDALALKESDAEIEEATLKATGYLPSHWDRSTRLAWATQVYLTSLNLEDLPEHHELVSHMLEQTKIALRLHGKFDKDGDLTGHEVMTPTPTGLEPFQVARLMMSTTPLALVQLASEHSELMAYQSDGKSEGTYSSDLEMLRLGVRRFVASYKVREVDEVLAVLRQEAPRQLPNKEPHLSPVANGVNVEIKIENNRPYQILATLLLCGAIGMVAYALAKNGWLELAATMLTVFLIQLTRMLFMNGIIGLPERQGDYDFKGTKGLLRTMVADFREWQAKSAIWRLALLATAYTLVFMLARAAMGLVLGAFTNVWIAGAAAALLASFIIFPSLLGNAAKYLGDKAPQLRKVNATGTENEATTANEE